MYLIHWKEADYSWHTYHCPKQRKIYTEWQIIVKKRYKHCTLCKHEINISHFKWLNFAKSLFQRNVFLSHNQTEEAVYQPPWFVKFSSHLRYKQTSRQGCSATRTCQLRCVQESPWAGLHRRQDICLSPDEIWKVDFGLYCNEAGLKKKNNWKSKVYLRTSFHFTVF